MNNDPESAPPDDQNSVVPWDSRDVWMGLGLFLAISFIFIFVLGWLIWGISGDYAVDLLFIVGEITFLIPVWWFAARKYNSQWSDFGFRKFKPVVLAIGFGLILAVNFLTGIYSTIIEEVFNSPMQPDLEPVAEEMALPWLLIVIAVVIAPFVEELFFRGFVFGGLRNRYGWKKAAVISSAIFAVGHLEPYAILPLFALGFVFSYLYQYSKSIWPGIILHFIVNGWAVIFEFVIAD